MELCRRLALSWVKRSWKHWPILGYVGCGVWSKSFSCNEDGAIDVGVGWYGFCSGGVWSKSFSFNEGGEIDVGVGWCFFGSPNFHYGGEISILNGCKVEISSFDRLSLQTGAFSFFEAAKRGKCLVLSVKPSRT